MFGCVATVPAPIATALVGASRNPGALTESRTARRIDFRIRANGRTANRAWGNRCAGAEGGAVRGADAGSEANSGVVRTCGEGAGADGYRIRACGCLGADRCTTRSRRRPNAKR